MCPYALLHLILKTTPRKVLPSSLANRKREAQRGETFHPVVQSFNSRMYTCQEHGKMCKM